MQPFFPNPVGGDGATMLPSGSVVIVPPSPPPGIPFRTRLHVRWARFMTLTGWEWWYRPGKWYGWRPDFAIVLPCGHSECEQHTLLATVLPYASVGDFDRHACTRFGYGGFDTPIPADASAAFGIDPSVSVFEMAHGAGGGRFDVPFFVYGWEQLWMEASLTA